MTTLEEHYQEFLPRLEGVKEQANGQAVARCPAHDDQTPSLSISPTSQRILLKCYAGCKFEDIVRAVGMEPQQFFAPKESRATDRKREVARYRYEGPDGDHRFDVVRFDPKDFRPQRPDGKWALTDVERVPYRLPQMLEAIKQGEDVVLVEGEKDADKAAKFGLVATTFLGGAGKWRDEYLQWFRGGTVVCVPDNDAPGRKGMAQIATSIATVAKKVVWLDLPGLPEKGDLSDWLIIEGNDSEAFQALVREQGREWTPQLKAEFAAGEMPPEDWPDPIPLIREDNEPQPYPVTALGTITTTAVNEFHEYGQQPLAMIGSSTLAALSLCAQGHADVARDSQNVGPISLSILCVAESGERKTTVDSAFSKALKQWQRDRNMELEPMICESLADHAAWKAEKEGITAAIRDERKKKSGTDDEVIQLREKLRGIEKLEPGITRPVQLFFEEATPEALAWFAGVGHPSFSLWSDEGGLTIGGRGMSEDSLMEFLSLLNRLWDGGSFEPTRKTTKTSAVVGRRNTVNLMMQSAVLERLEGTQDGISRSLGSLARFLVLQPPSTQGTRTYREPPSATPKQGAFHQRIRELMAKELPLNERGELEPPVLQLSPGAKAMWVEFFNTVEAALAPDGEFAGIRDFASKAGEQAARIAGVLRVFDGASGEISEGVMVRALALASWYLNEARRIFTSTVAAPEIRKAKLLLDWLVARASSLKLSQLPQREILMYGPNRVRNKEQRDHALAILEEHGFLRQLQAGNRHLIELNPCLLKQ